MKRAIYIVSTLVLFALTACSGVSHVAAPPVPAPMPAPVHVSPSKPVSVIHRALCVGMADSAFAGACPGADVDADVFSTLCREQKLQVIQLADRQCTRSIALALLRQAVSIAASNSLLVLFWSGHGGQVADRNGDEADGLDEYLCPWDRPLLDDDLAKILDQAQPGVRVFFVCDTCNSGTMARKALRMPRVVTPRQFKASMICFAGCADGKSSFGTAQGGLWTTALIDAWHEGISYRAWFAAAVKRMSGTDQLPQWTEYGDVSSWADGPALR